MVQVTNVLVRHRRLSCRLCASFKRYGKIPLIAITDPISYVARDYYCDAFSRSRSLAFYRYVLSRFVHGFFGRRLCDMTAVVREICRTFFLVYVYIIYIFCLHTGARQELTHARVESCHYYCGLHSGAAL